MNKERIVVVAPGRGSYSRENTGVLNQNSKIIERQLSLIDSKRKSQGYMTITELDKQNFKSNVHMAGENASPLIYACSLADFYSIDRAKYEVVAITGNSMGWYTALALANTLSEEHSYHLIQSMGSMMKKRLIGGQIIYPIIDEDWKIKEEKIDFLNKQIKKYNAYISIYLGGYVVIGGESDSLNSLLSDLPKEDKYPFQIPFNGAFHTPLMNSISSKVDRLFNLLDFKKPNIPIVDGRGKIWSPFSTDISGLSNYTLKHQVNKTYDFSTAIEVSLKEFCPDKIVLLGPGYSLGGAIAQILIKNNWLDINSKDDFKKNQNKNPFLLSMGLIDQRKRLC
jgi:malonyl CoA-acyl carrier protein transacylase